MKSNTFEQAEKFYRENKKRLLKIMLDEFKGTIDQQKNRGQVVAWFDGFSLHYTNGNMRGPTKDQINCGLNSLKKILEKDDRFNALIAKDEYCGDEYLELFTHIFCSHFALKNNIQELLKN